MNQERLLSVALESAKKAGQEVTRYYKNGNYTAEIKDDNSPVTSADIAANDILMDELKRLTPDIPIISEEVGALDLAQRSKWTRYWLLDPIDGTGEFIAGSGDFAIGNWSAIGYKASSSVLKINNAANLTSNNLTIDTNGIVGINADAPYDSFSNGNNKLHVYGNDSSLLVGDLATYSAMRLLGSVNDNTSYIQSGTSAADTDAKIAISRMDTASTNVSDFKVYSDKTTYYGNIALNSNWISNDGGDEGIKVGNDGNVAIGKVPGATHVFELGSGQGAQATSTLWVNTSDERVKENIVTIDTSSALDKIALLRPVSFNYTEDFCHCVSSNPDLTHYNFLAQEVEVIFPDSVMDTDGSVEDHVTGETLVSNLKGLDAHAINVHLVAAIQELKVQLDAALVRITQLES